MSINTKLKKVNVMNDAVAKAFLRSKEARMIVASFLSEVTGIDKSVLMNATYTGGEIPKRRSYEKNKESDVMILIDELNRIIIEVNQFNTENLYRKNTEYAMASILEMTKRKSKRDGKGNIQYPKVILVSLDNFNSFHTKRPILTFLPRDEEGHIENDLYQSIHIILDNAVNNEYNKYIPEEVIKFAKLLKAKSIDELVEEFEGDEEYMEAVGKLEELVMDPDFAGAYDKGAKTEWLLEDMRLTGLHEGEAIGISKGIEQGSQNKQIEIAKNMLNQNMDVNLISNVTGLSIEEIESLVEKKKVYSRKK